MHSYLSVVQYSGAAESFTDEETKVRVIQSSSAVTTKNKPNTAAAAAATELNVTKFWKLPRPYWKNRKKNIWQLHQQSLSQPILSTYSPFAIFVPYSRGYKQKKEYKLTSSWKRWVERDPNINMQRIVCVCLKNLSRDFVFASTRGGSRRAGKHLLHPCRTRRRLYTDVGAPTVSHTPQSRPSN